MTEPDRFADTHLALLRVLSVVWGAIGLLLGAALLLLAAGAAAIAGAPARETGALATRVTAASLTAFGIVLLAGGGAHVWIGARLAPGRSAVRLVALVVALANLPLLPFGPAFGAYALRVLLDDRVRHRFDASP